MYLQDHQVGLRLQFHYQWLLQHFVTVGIEIDVYQGSGSLHCLHWIPISNSQQATMQNTSFEDRNEKRIPFTCRFAVACSRGQPDFECCLHVVLLVRLNREIYWRLPCMHCHSTLAQWQLRYHILDQWYQCVFDHCQCWHFRIGCLLVVVALHKQLAKGHL